jgi:uncharacterized protein YjbI with pentapeptide repeats
MVRRLGRVSAIVFSLSVAVVTSLVAVPGIGVAAAQGSYTCAYVENPTPEHHMECAGKNLTGISVSPGANLSYADFTRANMTNATLSIQIAPPLSPTIFARSNFSASDLSGAKFEYADLQDTNLTDARLTGARLKGAVLSSATLSGVSSGGIMGVPRAMPPRWSLVGGYLIGPYANLSHANLTGLDLSSVTLTHVKSGDISGAPSALPPGWKVVNGYLVGPGTNLRNASLRGSDLSGVSLRGAELSGADLEGANLRGVDLTGAEWGSGTVCPDGAKTGDSLTSCDDHLGRWSYIRLSAVAPSSFSSPCTERYGIDGRQRCDVRFIDVPGPDPNIGYWPFTSVKDGTVIVDKVSHNSAMRLSFFTSPNSAIDGETPSENSNRYAVATVIIDGRSGLLSTPERSDRFDAGAKGGPLVLTVKGTCNAVGYCDYDFHLSGYLWVK